MELRLDRRPIPVRCDWRLLPCSENPDDQLPHTCGKSHNEYTDHQDNSQAEPTIGREKHRHLFRRHQSCPTLYTLSGTRGVSVRDGLCVDRQGGDEEDRQGAEEGRDEREGPI
jgi:hypothetical protein